MKKIYLSLIIALAGTLSVSAQSTPCAADAGGNIGDLDCADLGTAAYGTEVPVATFSATSATAPSGTSDCGVAYGSTGSWTHYTVDDAVNTINYGFEGGSVAKGYKDNYMAFFQGPDCSTLTSIDCVSAIYFDKGNLYINTPEVIEGVDGTQDLWVYNWNNDGKGHTLDWALIGSSDGVPANEDCANAIPADDGLIGCNLGAPGEDWGTPAPGYWTGCGSWSSNENTVYYTVTATSTGGAIVELQNILCNDGSTGDDFAQVGIYEMGDCSTFGTAAHVNPDFVDCATGTGGITLSFTATFGVEYMIVIDGNAGDVCQWGFDITNLEPTPMSNENVALSVSKHNDNNGLLTWYSNSEDIVTYQIEKATNDVWEKTGEINVEGKSSGSFSFIDEETNFGVVLYRIKQLHSDGSVSFSNMKSLNFVVKNTPDVAYNINKGAVEIAFGGNQNGMYSYNLYDVAGKLIDDRAFSVHSSERTFSFDASAATQNGIYFVVIRDNNTNEGFTFKFAK